MFEDMSVNYEELTLDISEEDKNKPFILYGAGTYAKRSLKLIISKGIKPVCFADRNTDKQDKTYLGYDVMSVESAINKYPRALILLTVDRVSIMSAMQSVSQSVSQIFIFKGY
jgi:hypothetical protein